MNTPKERKRKIPSLSLSPLLGDLQERRDRGGERYIDKNALTTDRSRTGSEDR